MDALCDEARQLVDDVRAQRQDADSTYKSKPTDGQKGGTTADRIRQLILDEYIKPARSRGDKTIIIRSGDVHAQMQLHQQHANVCQALKGNKLLEMAEIKLLSITGPKAGGNTYFVYKL